TATVLRVIEQALPGGGKFWIEKPETANRVRGRIEAILDWAKVRGYRSGDNPARWKGHLRETLPERRAVQAVQHRRALPYDALGSFMKALRTMPGASARALEFQILTCVRPGEALGAQWSEIDVDNALWTIPGHRMKGRKGTADHRVP